MWMTSQRRGSWLLLLAAALALARVETALSLGAGAVGARLLHATRADLWSRIATARATRLASRSIAHELSLLSGQY